jgi:hypothetical protein
MGRTVASLRARPRNSSTSTPNLCGVWTDDAAYHPLPVSLALCILLTPVAFGAMFLSDHGGQGCLPTQPSLKPQPVPYWGPSLPISEYAACTSVDDHRLIRKAGYEPDSWES